MHGSQVLAFLISRVGSSLFGWDVKQLVWTVKGVTLKPCFSPKGVGGNGLWKKNCSPHLAVAFRPCVSGDLKLKMLLFVRALWVQWSALLRDSVVVFKWISYVTRLHYYGSDKRTNKSLDILISNTQTNLHKLWQNSFVAYICFSHRFVSTYARWFTLVCDNQTC